MRVEGRNVDDELFLPSEDERRIDDIGVLSAGNERSLAVALFAGRQHGSLHELYEPLGLLSRHQVRSRRQWYDQMRLHHGDLGGVLVESICYRRRKPQYLRYVLFFRDARPSDGCHCVPALPAAKYEGGGPDDRVGGYPMKLGCGSNLMETFQCEMEPPSPTQTLLPPRATLFE